MRLESQMRKVPYLQEVRKFTDLRFAELICGQSTFANNTVLYSVGWVGLW
jgi:hypothetical protein